MDMHRSETYSAPFGTRKRNISLFGFALIVPFFLSLALSAQWQPSGGLEGGYISDIAIVDSFIFIDVAGYGVCKKQLAHTNWQQSLGPETIKCIEKAGHVVIAQTFSKLFRSFDYGENWEEIDLAMNFYNTETIDTVLFTTAGWELYRSHDYGDTWTLLNYVQGTTTYIREFYASDSILFIETTHTDSILISDDLGDTWQPIPKTGLPDEYFGILCFYFYSGSYWIGTSHGYGIFVFNEMENAWESVKDGLPSNIRIYDFDEFDGSFYCCGTKGVFRYMQNNNCWVPENDGLENHNTWAIESNDSIQYCSTGYGPCYRSSASDWIANPDSLYHLEINSFCLSDSVIWACGQSGLYKSLDEGETFIRSCPSSELRLIKDLIVTDSIYYAATEYGFYVSNDFGQNWEAKNSGFSPDSTPYIHSIAIDQEYCFAATYNGLYRIRHGYNSWNKVPSGLGNMDCRRIVNKDSIILVFTCPDGTFRSADQGGSFQQIQQGFIVYHSNETHFFGIGQPPMRSPDGIHWDSIFIPEQYYKNEAIFAGEEEMLIGGTENVWWGGDSFVIYSYDSGAEWHDLTDNLPNSASPIIKDVAILDDRILVAQGAMSVYYRDNLPTFVFGHFLQNDNDLTVFPNPVQNYVTIAFSDADFSDPVLSVYNMYGQKIKSIEASCKPGDKCNIAWDLSDLPSGIYIIRAYSESIAYSSKFIKE